MDLSERETIVITMSAKKVILVTGSNGLAGHAIQAVLKDGEQREDEEWHFVDIEDADLL